MNGDGIIINLEDRKKSVIKDARFVASGPPSQDAIALAFVRLYGDRYRYVPAWQRWIGWDGKRWAIDHHNAVSATIRTIIRAAVGGTCHERRIATANYIRGAEQMARYDPAVALEPSALDADPWLLNTQADIVNLRDGGRRPHDPVALITRITAAAPANAEGEALWAQFLVMFALATGLRHANVVGLMWSHVNLDANHAWVDADKSKNGRPIAVPLNATAVDVLRRQLGKHPQHVFTYEGKRVLRANPRAWGNALKRAGIENFRWHETRHTWATWHRQAGTSTHELQRLGGWRSAVMVERYAHLAPDHLARAASRIDSLLPSYDLATSTNKSALATAAD